MKIYESQRRVWYLRTVSFLIMIVSSLFLLISALKSIAWSANGDTTAFASVGNDFIRVINKVYENTLFLSEVWRIAPVLNFEKINSSATYGFIFIACCIWLGRLMWDSANHLSMRIKNVIRRVEEFGWEKVILEQQGLVPGQRPDVLQINIDLQQKDQWFKRPIGMITIGVAVAVLGQWANLRFGLVK